MKMIKKLKIKQSASNRCQVFQAILLFDVKYYPEHPSEMSMLCGLLHALFQTRIDQKLSGYVHVDGRVPSNGMPP